MKINYHTFAAAVKKAWDYSWLAIFIVYQLLFVVLSTKAMTDEELPIACSFIILLEQVRTFNLSCNNIIRIT